MGSCDDTPAASTLSCFCDPYYNDKGLTLYLAFGLMLNPMLTFFLLRDTYSAAIFFSWVVAVVILYTFAIVLGSADIAITTTVYVFVSTLIYFDTTHQRSERREVLARLQSALIENGRLAEVEEAKELRAMMGNMAHDLKTVRAV